MKNSFIQSTANDYCMNYETVLAIRNKYPDSYEDFYNALEEELKIRKHL